MQGSLRQEPHRDGAEAGFELGPVGLEGVRLGAGDQRHRAGAAPGQAGNLQATPRPQPVDQPRVGALIADIDHTGAELLGQRGNDILTGGRGADLFVFGSGDGDDTVTDFQIGLDLIRITSGADAFRDLRITSHGDDVRVSFDDVTILLQGVDADDLARSDFLFT